MNDTEHVVLIPNRVKDLRAVREAAKLRPVAKLELTVEGGTASDAVLVFDCALLYAQLALTKGEDVNEFITPTIANGPIAHLIVQHRPDAPAAPMPGLAS